MELPVVPHAPTSKPALFPFRKLSFDKPRPKRKAACNALAQHLQPLVLWLFHPYRGKQSDPACEKATTAHKDTSGCTCPLWSRGGVGANTTRNQMPMKRTSQGPGLSQAMRLVPLAARSRTPPAGVRGFGEFQEGVGLSGFGHLTLALGLFFRRALVRLCFRLNAA